MKMRIILTMAAFAAMTTVSLPAQDAANLNLATFMCDL